MRILRDDCALLSVKGESEGRDAGEKLGAVPRHTRMSYYGIVFEQSAAGDKMMPGSRIKVIKVGESESQQ